MGRTRTPLAKARATGRILHDPQRFRDRKEPQSAPLGNPSPHLSMMEQVAWHAFRRELPWLMEADRGILEMACQLRAALWERFDLALMAPLRLMLSAMGATPADRSRVHVPPDDGDDAAAEFIN